MKTRTSFYLWGITCLVLFFVTSCSNEEPNEPIFDQAIEIDKLQFTFDSEGVPQIENEKYPSTSHLKMILEGNYWKIEDVHNILTDGTTIQNDKSGWLPSVPWADYFKFQSGGKTKIFHHEIDTDFTLCYGYFYKDYSYDESNGHLYIPRAISVNRPEMDAKIISINSEEFYTVEKLNYPSHSDTGYLIMHYVKVNQEKSDYIEKLYLISFPILTD